MGPLPVKPAAILAPVEIPVPGYDRPGDAPRKILSFDESQSSTAPGAKRFSCGHVRPESAHPGDKRFESPGIRFASGKHRWDPQACRYQDQPPVRRDDHASGPSGEAQEVCICPVSEVLRVEPQYAEFLCKGAEHGVCDECGPLPVRRWRGTSCLIS